MTQTQKNWLTTVGGTFITALSVYAAQNEPVAESWSAWKPILIAAICSAFLATYHAYQPQSGSVGSGSGSSGGPTATAPVIDAKKDPVTAEADKLSMSWLWGSSSIVSVAFALFVGALLGCHESPAAVEAQVIDLTNAVCALAPDSPVGGPTVEIVCAIVQPIEQAVSVVIGAVEDGGLAAKASVKTDRAVYHFPLPASVAQAFLAAHSSKDAGK